MRSTQRRVSDHKNLMHLNLYMKWYVLSLKAVVFLLNPPLQTQVKFPELQKFVNCWPIEDMLKNYLKNSSNKWCTAQRKKQLNLGLTKGQTKKGKRRDSSCKFP